MTEPSLSRDHILEALQSTLEPLEGVLAMWQGGAAAFDRLDQWSDIDLMVLTRDEDDEAILKLIEEALAQLSPIEAKLELPMPTWHGHLQSFFRLRDASPFLFIDLVVLKQSSPNRFLERQIHGRHLVHFDKGDYLADNQLDRAAHILKLRDRKQAIEKEFALFQELTRKELLRRNWLDALTYYQRFTLQPILELLRMQHSPGRYNFGLRYLYVDLPEDLVTELEPLFFPQPGADFEDKFERAQALYARTLAEFDWSLVERNLNAA